MIERNDPDRRMAPVKFRSGRKARLQVLERKEFTGDGAGGDGWWACEPDRSGAGAARKVPVDGADGYLFGIDRDAGTALAAGTAGGLQDFRSDLPEGVKITFADAVVSDRYGSALQIKRDTIRDPEVVIRRPS